MNFIIGSIRSLSVVKKSIITFAAFVIGLQIYIKFKKHQSNQKTENLTYKNNDLPKVGSVIGHVLSLHIYPIKSCQAVTTKSTKFDINGFLYDRLITAVNARLTPITQRMIPKLALIKVEMLNPDIVVLSAPHKYKLQALRLNIKSIQTSNAWLKTISLHGVDAKCKDCGDKAAEWLNNTLSIITGKRKKNNRFVMIMDGETRKVCDSMTRFYLDDCQPYDSTRLADISPLTLVSTASLKALNGKIGSGKSVPIDRFRSNIVLKPINDNYAFLEDHICKLQIGKLELRVISPTFRCIIPSVNQETGETEFFKCGKNCEPLATLRRTRSSLRYGATGLLPATMGGSRGLAPLFGLKLGFNLTASHVESGLQLQDEVIQEGDEVIVLAYKEGSNSFINRLFLKIERFFGFNTLE